jgi:glutaredoxin 3
VAKDVVVYTTDPCSFCSRVKQLLSARGIEYTEINHGTRPGRKGRARRQDRDDELPAGRHRRRGLGGFQETLAADQSGQLRELISA